MYDIGNPAVRANAYAVLGRWNGDDARRATVRHEPRRKKRTRQT